MEKKKPIRHGRILVAGYKVDTILSFISRVVYINI